MRYSCASIVSLALCVSIAWCTSAQCAPQAPETGSIELSAYVRPSGGQPEPVRQMTFYVLRQSLSEIFTEAERAEGGPDMNQFIDSLDASPELKAWMKKHERVNLSGPDFIKMLTPADVVEVPEFLDAYKLQNGSALHAVLPEPKYKDSDAEKNPEKFQRERERYRTALKHYIEANLDSVDSLDAELADKNPNRRWFQSQTEQQQRVEHKVLQLAMAEYLAAKATSNLDGRATFSKLAPGAYWITNLDTPAFAGQLRLRWDVPVTVSAGQIVRIELSNLNALDPADHPIH